MSRKILIINTGGTLSAVMKKNGLIPGLSIHDMQKELKMVSGDTDIEIEDFCSVDSANIFPEDWCALAQRISDCRNDYDGIVVIHGTDTLAYTSSMLSFMLRNINIPVVITGSQLSITNPVADAMENCRCAIHMAASQIPGVFVAFNRKVILGCIEAYGIGGIPFLKHDFIGALDKVIQNGMTVVVGTQCRYEGTKMDVYETGKRAMDIGALEARDMTGEAALTKLMWILGMTEDIKEIRDYYAINMAGELTKM